MPLLNLWKTTGNAMVTVSARACLSRDPLRFSTGSWFVLIIVVLIHQLQSNHPHSLEREKYFTILGRMHPFISFMYLDFSLCIFIPIPGTVSVRAWSLCNKSKSGSACMHMHESSPSRLHASIHGIRVFVKSHTHTHTHRTTHLFPPT